jgi:hypothetical protein
MAPRLPTGGSGRALALAITLLAVAAAWAGVIAPLQDWYHDRAEMLRRQDAVAHRMAALVETLPALRREAEAAAHRGLNSGDADGAAASPLLPGESDALEAAHLQQRIDDLATNAGVRISSQEILPGQPGGTLHAIPVRLSVTAPYRSLVSLFLALARSKIPMVADEITLRGRTATARDTDLPVDATLTVTSYRTATAAAR